MDPNSVGLYNIPFIPLMSSKNPIFDRYSGNFHIDVLVVVVPLSSTVETRAIITTLFVPA